jgi:PiT family inorganic phosphate transporter
MFGVNNSGLSTGSLLASGFSFRKGIVVTGTGFLVGALLEGWKMKGTITGLTGLGDVGLSVPLTTLIITSIMFSIFSFWGIPMSLVNILVGSYVGAGLAAGYNLNYTYLNMILLSWVALPVIAAVATVGCYSITIKLLARMSPIGVGRFYLVAMPVIVFYTAYSLGANNIGVLHSSILHGSQFLEILLLVLLPIGSFFGVMKSGKTSRFVSEGVVGHSPTTVFSSLLVGAVLVWLFTQVAIPVSLSQLLIGGLVGVNLFRKPKVYNRDALMKLIVIWTGVTVLSFFAALALQQFLVL